MGRVPSGQSTRLLIAAFLGGCIGFERRRERKAAGRRRHIPVATGATLGVSFNTPHEISLVTIKAFCLVEVSGYGFTLLVLCSHSAIGIVGI